MRKPIAPCACVLALLTGAWVGQAYALFSPPEPIGAADTLSQLVVGTAWRFYDAIEILLRTGDDGALRAVVDPDFVDHPDEPVAASGRDGLVGYLASLRETYPALRLVPEEVIAQGDRVVARLVLSGDADGAILGIPLAGVTPWPRVDVVRVRGDRIVERWGSPAGYAPSAVLDSESLTFSDHGDMVPFLRRVTFAPGAGYQTTGQPGRVIVSVESGALDIGTDGVRGSPSPAMGGSQETTPSGPSPSRTLGPGDTPVIPEGVALAAHNRADTPAVILLLELVQPVATATRASDGRASLRAAGITAQALADTW